MNQRSKDLSTPWLGSKKESSSYRRKAIASVPFFKDSPIEGSAIAEMNTSPSEEFIIMDKLLERRSYRERRMFAHNEPGENLRKNSMDRRIINRRNTPRIFGNFNAQIKSFGKNKKVEAEVLNMGNRGIYIESENFLGSKGAVLDILFNIDGDKLKIQSTVVWQKKDDLTNKYRCGLMINTEKDKIIALEKMLWMSKEYIRQIVRPQIEKMNLNEILKQKIIGFFENDVNTFARQYSKNEKAILRGFLEKEEAKNVVRELINQIVEKGNLLFNDIQESKILSKIKEIFRQTIGCWIYQSELMTHALTKPRGYPGDYKMIEIVYNNKLISKKIGQGIDRYFLDDAYAVAVRNRKKGMGKILKEQIKKVKINETLKIMNAACGSSREIKELFEKKMECQGKVIFSLIDHDKEALDYTRASLMKVKPKWAELDLIEENILRLRPGNEKYVNKFIGYNLLYSIGLADYLPDKILLIFYEFCKKVMANNGCLVIAHKDKDRYEPIPHNWYADWNFIPRNYLEFMELTRKVFGDDYRIETIWEPSEIIFFLKISKKERE